MRSEQIKYFLEAAQCGSMSEVADKHFLTQPAVSTAISKLEEELGTALVVRSNQGVSLTDAGRRAQEIFGEMEHLLQTLQADLAQYKKQAVHWEEGAIHLATTLELSTSLVDRCMKQFYPLYPNCIFSIRECDFWDVLAAVGKGQCEFGVFCIVEELLSEAAVQEQMARFGLRADKIGTERLMIGVKSDSPLAQKESIALKQVLKKPLVIYNSSVENCWHDQFLAKYHFAGKTVKTNRPAYLAELVQQKDYLVFVLNGHLLETSRQFPEKVSLLPVREPIKITIGVLRREDKPLSPLAEVFIQQMKSQLQT